MSVHPLYCTFDIYDFRARVCYAPKLLFELHDLLCVSPPDNSGQCYLLILNMQDIVQKNAYESSITTHYVNSGIK